MRWISFLTFFSMVVLVDGLLHWFLWARLVRDPGWPDSAKVVGTVLTIFFAVATPLGMILTRFLPSNAVKPLATAIYVWMGVAFILFSVVLFAAIAKLVFTSAVAMLAKLGGEGPLEDPARRELLAKGVAAATGAVGLVASGAALRSGLAEVEVKEVGVKLARLPPALSGLSVVQFSDVHVGPLLQTKFIETLVEQANRQRPDLVVITGDLVDGSLAELKEHVQALGRLKSRFGTYFVTGNHEYYSGVDAWLPELRRLGIRVLRNERVVLGDAGASIDLAGVDDSSAGRFGQGHGADVGRATAGRDRERELLLLAHQPKAIVDAASAGVGLQLSGHTHGGQIWPFNHVVGLVQPYVAGLYQHDPTTQIYVSRGTGFWGPPMRLAAPAEITKLVLAPG